MATTEGEYTALITSVSTGGKKLFGGIFRDQICVYGGCTVSAKPGLKNIPETTADVVVDWHPDAVHHPPSELKESLAKLLATEALKPKHRVNWQYAMFGRPE